MTITDIHNSIKEIIANVIAGDYERVYLEDYEKRLDKEMIQEGFADYPGSITLFPDSAFDLMTVYKYSDSDYSVDFPLWYDNERSDLTMVCDFKDINGEIRYSIQGILVQ